MKTAMKKAMAWNTLGGLLVMVALILVILAIIFLASGGLDKALGAIGDKIRFGG